jgi:prohibitin 2
VIPLTAPKMSGGFPKNFQELQKQLAKAQEQGRRFGAGGGGGAPRGALGGLAGLIILGGGAVVLSNSLFNGRNDDNIGRAVKHES